MTKTADLPKIAFADYIGVKITHLSKDRVEGELVVRDELETIPGVLHGTAHVPPRRKYDHLVVPALEFSSTSLDRREALLAPSSCLPHGRGGRAVDLLQV